MDYLNNLLAITWELRYVMGFATGLLFLALWLEARHERDQARAEARGLYFDNAELRARLAAHRRTRLRRPMEKGPVVSR